MSDAGPRAPGQVKEITSLSNPIIKDTRALSMKKHRDETGTFLAEGLKLVIDAIDQRVLGVHMLGVAAPEIVQALAVAITMGARKSDFDATMAMHPTAAEEFMLMRTARNRI